MIAILTPLLYALGPMALLLVVAILFAETGLMAGFFLPGDSLLFMTGALVASGVIGVPFWLLVLSVYVAAAAGDQLGFQLGRRFGPRVFSRPESRLFRQEHADRAQRFFVRHGPAAVVVARFVPVIRSFVPVAAGVARMPVRRFTGWNLLGALVWAVGIATTGYLSGGIPFVAAHIELVTIAIATGSLVPATAELLRRRRHASAPAAAPAALPVLDAPEPRR